MTKKAKVTKAPSVLYPKSDSDASATLSEMPTYLTWDTETGKQAAIEQSANCVSEYTAIQRSTASSIERGGYNRDYSNLMPGISSKPGMYEEDKSFFRPDEIKPSVYRELIYKCNAVYQNVGFIQNIINAMGDFASQGIRPVHPNKKIQDFHNNWWAKVNAKERSERFANYLCRVSNVVVHRQTGPVNTRQVERMYKTHAGAEHNDVDFEETTIKVTKKNIPLKYTFLNPGTITAVGGGLASFVGSPMYALTIPDSVKRTILAPKNDLERNLVSQIPKDILDAVSKSQPYMLPQDRVSIYHYKKDDWNSWAFPIIHSVYKDVVHLDRLKLADAAALDGAISNIRIFKLGNLEHRILPTKEATARLSSILQSNVGVGTIDLIWGPDIELVESKTEVHKFLGSEKYQETLNSIYAAFGISPGMTGAANNFIGLKVFVEKLKQIRDILTEFWNNELYILQQALGFRFPATVEYDIMDFANEETMKKLYIDLLDRNVFSDETIQRIFEKDPKMESARLAREGKARKAGKMPDKAGPFMEPEPTQSLKKISLQQGTSSPSEVGLDLHPRKAGEKSVLDIKGEQDKLKQTTKIAGKQVKSSKPKGQPGQGRPSGSKDVRARKSRNYSPSRAAIEMWANKAQSAIAEIINPGLLEQYGKKNFRQLTDAQAKEAEIIRFGVLIGMEPLSKVGPESVMSALASKLPAKASRLYNRFVSEVVELSGEQPTSDELKQIRAKVYTQIKGSKHE